jgi:hypothetical protein
VDRVFWQFIRSMLVIMTLFCLGGFIVIFVGETALGLKIITSFASMFAGVLGLGSGYFLGHKQSEDKGGKEDPSDRT